MRAGKRSGKRWCYCARGSNPEQTVLSVCSPNCCYGEISSERRGPGSLFDVCSNSNGALSGALKSVRARRVFVGVFEPCASAWIQDTGSAAVASLPEVLHFAASCMHYFFFFSSCSEAHLWLFHFVFLYWESARVSQICFLQEV